MIAENSWHARLVKFNNALQAHPEYRQYLPPDLLKKVEAQVALVAPLLVAAEQSAESAKSAEFEATFDKTRELIKQVHAGLEYRYKFAHAEQLKDLAPLVLGFTPAEDEVRLATLIRVVPTLKPAFTWLADDGLTVNTLTKAHKAQEEAQKAEGDLGKTEKGALKSLRVARPASKALWTEETGLDAWIKAHIPAELQYAFGRERRSRPRAAGEPATTTTAPADSQNTKTTEPPAG